MLIAFSVSNFRSFSGEQSCDFLASPDDAHEATHCVPTGFHALPRLTKTAALFGPNASGKTNLLLALRTMREIVLHSTSFTDDESSELYTPFRFALNPGTPTSLGIDVLLDDIRYRYTFSYDSKRILSEQLLVNNSRKSQRWFGRHFDFSTKSDSWEPFSSKFTGAREMWRKATRSRALYLTTAGDLGAEQFQPLLRWYENALQIVLASDVADLAGLGARMRDPRFKARMLGVLRAVDIQVDDVRVVDSSPGRGMRPALEFLYSLNGSPPAWLNSSYESAGVQRLVRLLVPLIDAIETGKMIAIDELDSSLHPLVARFLIQLVHDPSLSNKRAQLMLTSHNTALMDLKIFRRDEIWLMRLDASRSSQVTALTDHSPRKQEIVAKGYLSGRYGALPEIDRDRVGSELSFED